MSSSLPCSTSTPPQSPTSVDDVWISFAAGAFPWETIIDLLAIPAINARYEGYLRLWWQQPLRLLVCIGASRDSPMEAMVDSGEA